MTSSDRTVLPPGTKTQVAGRVGTSIDGSALATQEVPRPTPTVALACAEFNGGITARLLAGALDALGETGCDLSTVTVVWVPGAFELPVVARALATTDAVDAVVCLGAVIRGDTGHYDFVAGQCAAGLQRVQLDTGVPVVFGVLTTDTVDQALARSEPDASNKGREAAATALATVAALAAVSRLPARGRVGFSARQA
jgi:6,7-dimethyl-8-ribityllumazine synthase